MTMIQIADQHKETMLEALEHYKAGIFDVRTRYPKAKHTDVIERIDAASAAIEAPASVQGGELLPDGVYAFDEWKYTQAIALRNGELSVYVGGTEVARLELGDMRLCRTPAPAMPSPLVMPPDRFGTVVIWPQGEVQERMFSSRIEIFPAYNPPFEPGIRWTGRELIGIEITRQWAKAMLLAANIAESMRQRPAAGGESND